MNKGLSVHPKLMAAIQERYPSLTRLEIEKVIYRLENIIGDELGAGASLAFVKKRQGNLDIAIYDWEIIDEAVKRGKKQ